MMAASGSCDTVSLRSILGAAYVLELGAVILLGFAVDCGEQYTAQRDARLTCLVRVRVHVQVDATGRAAQADLHDALLLRRQPEHNGP
jgi:hypothetical protein